MVDEKLDENQVWVTVVATGYGEKRAPRTERTGDERRSPALREPAGEPRVSRLPRERDRASRGVDVDVPEYIPRF